MTERSGGRGAWGTPLELCVHGTLTREGEEEPAGAALPGLPGRLDDGLEGAGRQQHLLGDGLDPGVGDQLDEARVVDGRLRVALPGSGGRRPGEGASAAVLQLPQLLLDVEAGDREPGLLHDLRVEDGDQLLLRSCGDLEGPFYSCLLSLVHFAPAH